MVKDITFGQFFPGKSFVHKMDARAKIIITFLLIIFIFVCKNFFSLGVMCVFSILAFVLTKLSPKIIFKSIKPLLPIILLTSVLQIWYNNNGDVLFEYKKLVITSGGIFTAVFIAVRIIALLVISSLLTYTTSPTELTDAIEKLLSPLKLLKIDIHTFAMMMTIALRFIPTLIDEIDRIMSAQKARGADFETGNIVQRIKALFPIFIPLFVSAFKRAFELADAMSCRCYSGGEGRTRLKQMKMTWRDAAAFVVSLLFCGGAIFLNIYFEKII